MRREWIAGALLLALTGRPSGAAEAPHLLKDIVSQWDGVSFDSLLGLPQGFFQINDRLLFSTPSGVIPNGGALWSTNGTPEGTQLVSSTICPFPCQSLTPLATWPGAALLEATADSTNGFAISKRLWRTDGTPAGTLPLTARLPTGGFEAFVAGPTPATGLFYFSDCDLQEGCQLWRSDGTLPGTHAVTDTKLLPTLYTSVAGRLYFLAAMGVEGSGLWVTDGTADGTRLLVTTPAGVSESDVMVATPSRFFFTAGDTNLWVSDGTPAGTRLVRQSAPYDYDCTYLKPFLELQGDTVYFLSADSVYGAQIWRSDGTESGTRRVTAIPDCAMAQAVPLLSAGGRRVFTFPAFLGALWTAGDDFSHPALLTDCKEGCPTFVTAYPFANESPPGLLLFVGKDDQHGQELWVTDGTGRGTRRLTDACPGACDGLGYDPLAARRLGKTYFRAADPSENDALWVTDGTPGGTRRIARFPAGLGSLGTRVFFGSTRSGDTSELWATDGTKAGSERVATLQTFAPGSDPIFAPMGDGALIFAAKGDFQTLWRSDGTPEGTVPVRGIEIPYLFGLQRIGSLGFAAVLSPQADRDEVWRTDGTAGGTFPVTDFDAGVYVLSSILWNGKYLFVVGGLSPAEDTGNCAFWISNGTRHGTRKIFPKPAGMRCPEGLYPFGSRFLFTARVESDGIYQVFISDGTAAGTRQVSNFRSPESVPVDFTAIGDVFFFLLYEVQTSHAEVWRTDGTPEGTQGFPLGLSDTGPLFAFQGSLYVTAVETRGRLWRVPLDGGAPIPLTDAIEPQGFRGAGGRLFFVAGDESHGSELWVTDGSPAGTRMVRDIQPGVPSSQPGELTAAGDRVFFAADDGVSGRELWVSDGTEEGTRLAWDLNPCGFSSSPSNLTVIGGYLFFGADDGKTGVEPWALRLEP